MKKFAQQEYQYHAPAHSSTWATKIEATGGCGADVDNRVRSAWNYWRGLSGVICGEERTNYTNLSSDQL